MKVYKVSSNNFNGRLRHGDLVKKLNILNENANIKATKILAKSDATAEKSLYKIFDNTDKITPKDNSKILTTATTSSTGLYSSAGSYTTNGMDTWSIYSSIL